MKVLARLGCLPAEPLRNGALVILQRCQLLLRLPCRASSSQCCSVGPLRNALRICGDADAASQVSRLLIGCASKYSSSAQDSACGRGLLASEAPFLRASDWAAALSQVSYHVCHRWPARFSVLDTRLGVQAG